MRRGSLVLLVVLVAGLIGAQAAGAGSSRATDATALSSVKLKVALPGPDSAGIAVLTVKTTARHDPPRGAIKVRGLNPDQLPSGIRAIAIVTPRTSHKRRATFTVYIAINNLTRRPEGDARVAALQHLEIVITDPFGSESSVLFTEDLTFPQDCGRFTALGSLIDENPGFAKLYPLAFQQSEPEEILDHLAYDRFKCPGAETPELGPA